MQDAAGFVLPWGRKHPAPRKDLLEAVMGRGRVDWGMRSCLGSGVRRLRGIIDSGG